MGDTIEDRYRVVRPIGVGGMGHVFLVDHIRLQKQLALKILSPEVLALDGGEAQKARFLLEARAASRLQHPGIVEVIDFGSTTSGLPFIVMEYLSGEDLAERLDRDGAMEWAPACALIVQVLEALEAAHAHGVVHRDIKPENCFLSRAVSGSETVKLVDFGIAKVLTEVSGAGPLTQRGELLGTPQYMSPEQALGRAIDERSDVYAVGILLYEVLSGTPPFDEGTPMEVLTHQITKPPPPLRERAPGRAIPEQALGVIAKALAKEPADRYESARAMIEALHDAAASASVSAAHSLADSVAEPLQSASVPTPILEAPPEPGRSHLPWVAAIALGVAAATGLAAWVLIGDSTSNDPATAAESR
ncbi:MAG: serine/threonine-protein kinase [Myxococcota bacterium]